MKPERPSRRGRPPTGCPKWNPEKCLWEARVLMPSGARRPVALTGIPEHDVERAHAVAKAVAIRHHEGGYVGAAAGETVNEWFARYYKAAERGDVGRKNRGAPQVSARDRERRFLYWISPLIGTKPMATIGADELRLVVRKLDEAIRVRERFYAEASPEEQRAKGRRPGLSAKAARNIWGECTGAFREACTSKIDALRVRGEDPTRGVQPPTTTGDRDQAALYPSELLALLGAPSTVVPLYRRALYAVAAYTGLRVGELRGLTPESIDGEHGVIVVRRQRRGGKSLARTKTRAGRRQVPIEEALVPLLEALAKHTADGEPLLRVPPPEDCAELVRKDLLAVGCTREELHADDGERQHFTFHGLRHTCLTHWAVAGRPMQWLLVAAGHTSYEVTQRYVDAAVVLRGTFGQPHPPLLPALIEEASANTVRNTVLRGAKLSKLLRPQRELKRSRELRRSAVIRLSRRPARIARCRNGRVSRTRSTRENIRRRGIRRTSRDRSRTT